MSDLKTYIVDIWYNGELKINQYLQSSSPSAAAEKALDSYHSSNADSVFVSCQNGRVFTFPLAT